MPTALAEAFLARLVTWLEDQADVAAALLVGSQARARQPADSWSDVDIVLIADDPSSYLDSSDWLAGLGAPIATFVEPTLLGQRERRVLFRDGLDVDFTVLPPAVADAFLAEQESVAGTVLRRGVRVLADRDGLAPRVAAIAATPVPPPAPPSQGEFDDAVHEFWYRVLWVARKLRRGELWLVTQAVNGRLHDLVILQLRWQAVADGRDAWHGARFVESWAPSEALGRLAATVVPYEAAAVPAALRALTALFSGVARDVAVRCELRYPAEVDAAVTPMLERTLAERQEPASPDAST